MPDPEDFDRLGDLLGGVCEAAAPTSKSNSASASSSTQRAANGVARALASAWPEIAGAEVAANASPVQLKNGRLTVSTSSSVWADTLIYMSADLTSRLNERLGSEVVTQMVFRHAGWEERPRQEAPEKDHRDGERTMAGTGPSGRLSVEQEEALAGVEALDLPPEIRESVTRAMRASFARNHRDSVR